MLADTKRLFTSNNHNLSSNHSPASNDSGFHSDPLFNDSQPIVKQSKRTHRIQHRHCRKPTYDSVFATDDSDSSSIFNDFNRRFSKSRPNCLTSPLLFRQVEEEGRPVTPITAPVIIPVSKCSSAISSSPVTGDDTKISLKNFENLEFILTEDDLDCCDDSKTSEEVESEKSLGSDKIKHVESASLVDSTASQLQLAITDKTDLSKINDEPLKINEMQSLKYFASESDDFNPKSNDHERSEIFSNTHAKTNGKLYDIEGIEESAKDEEKIIRKSNNFFNEKFSSSNQMCENSRPCSVTNACQWQASNSSANNSTENSSEKPSSSSHYSTQPFLPSSLRSSAAESLLQNSARGSITSATLPLSSSAQPTYPPPERSFTTTSTSETPQLTPRVPMKVFTSSVCPTSPESLNHVQFTQTMRKHGAMEHAVKTSSKIAFGTLYDQISGVSSLSDSNKSSQIRSKRFSHVNELIEQFSKIDEVPVCPPKEKTYNTATKRNEFQAQPLNPATRLTSGAQRIGFSEKSPNSQPLSLAKGKSDLKHDNEELKKKGIGPTTTTTIKNESNSTLSSDHWSSTSISSFSPSSTSSKEIMPTLEGNKYEETEKVEASAKQSVGLSNNYHRSTHLKEQNSLTKCIDYGTVEKKPVTKDLPKFSPPEEKNDFKENLQIDDKLEVRKQFDGLDYSRFHDITDDDIIGRPLEEEEIEQQKLLSSKEAFITKKFDTIDKPSNAQLAECQEILGQRFDHHDVFTVILKRSPNNNEGSVGVILTSTINRDQIITVHKVICGSIACQSDQIKKGDKVFFIQDQSTKTMSPCEARLLIKQPSETVKFILGRDRNKANEENKTTRKLLSTVSIDPESFKYSEQSEDINLFKGSLGIGLSLDGGRGCVYGDRPIVVKRIFEGGSAAKSGRVKVGDRIDAIEGISTISMSYLEATKTLRSRPEGPLTITIRSRIE